MDWKRFDGLKNLKNLNDLKNLVDLLRFIDREKVKGIIRKIVDCVCHFTLVILGGTGRVLSASLRRHFFMGGGAAMLA